MNKNKLRKINKQSKKNKNILGQHYNNQTKMNKNNYSQHNNTQSKMSKIILG